MDEITRTWRVVAPRFTAMFVLALSLSGLHAATTYAATTSGYRVTFVARHCASYTDVTANLARNDIQESLRDLGADTAYVSGQEIDVDIERANQPRCTAITGWQFKLGTGIGGRDTGTFGSLSKVSNPDATLVRTKASTPLFDRYGASTGRTVAGATTVTLTAAQVERATRRQLWSQGGVPGDPVLNATFPDEYGFAALRCAIDNLNGDNVEFIAFPSGVTHVVCYAYYVTPPPTSGEIVIEKSLTDVGADDRYDESFAYDSNLTYDPSNRFTVDVVDNAMGRRSFVRAETRPGDAGWFVAERPTAGWELASLTCTSRTNDSSVAISGGRAGIVLAAGDTVTCRYVNRPTSGGPFIVAKRTFLTPGTFPFTVDPPVGATAQRDLRTTRPLDPASWNTGFTAAGTYRVHEELPDSALGRWRVVGVNCDGTRYPARTTVAHRVSIASGGGRCLFSNAFVPRGSITVRGVTIGGTATVNWTVTGPDTFARRYAKSATTDESGVPVVAGGAATNRLRGGRYSIVQGAIVDPGQAWQLIDITCDGGIVERSLQGGTYVRLTEAAPHVTCTFTNVADAPSVTDPDDGAGSGGGTDPEPVDPPAIVVPPTGPTPDAVEGDQTAPVGGIATGLRAPAVPAPWRPWSADAALLTPAPDELPSHRAKRSTRTADYITGSTLRIADLGIRARLQPLARARDGRLQVPANPARVGWWTGGALPGAVGATVLAGHADGPNGPAVFSRLWRADRGDRITLTSANGLVVRYRVTGVAWYRKAALPADRVFGAANGRAELRLITCGGAFDAATGHYAENVVVTAVAI